MQDYLRLIIGCISFGAACYAMYHHYPIEYIGSFLIVSVVFIMNVERLRASPKEIEFNTTSRKSDIAEPINQSNNVTVSRLRDASVPDGNEQFDGENASHRGIDRD